MSNFSQIRNQKQFVARIKEIIITAGGENVAPTNIEEEIKSELPEVWRQIITKFEKIFTNIDIY